MGHTTRPRQSVAVVPGGTGKGEFKYYYFLQPGDNLKLGIFYISRDLYHKHRSKTHQPHSWNLANPTRNSEMPVQMQDNVKTYEVAAIIAPV